MTVIPTAPPEKQFTNQVFSRYLYEGLALLGDAVAAERIETCAHQIGMTSGPLRAMDQWSLQRADDELHRELHHLEHAHHEAHEHEHEHEHHHDHEGHGHSHAVKSKRMPESAVYVLEKMAHGFKRLGQEAGAGFYDYLDDDEPALWPGLSFFARGKKTVPNEDVADRLLYIQVLESVHCVAQNTVPGISQADIWSVRSCGFPAHTGGVISFLNSLGTATFCTRAAEMAALYGDRFVPPESLLALANANQPLSTLAHQ